MEKEMQKEIATTILNQLGGMGKLRAMVGASKFSYNEEEFEGFIQPYFLFDFKMNKKMKWCKIIYNQGKDSYVMQFISARGKLVKQYDEVYCDELIQKFEETTGLYLYL